MPEPTELRPLLSIVADDLAGAADTAAQLATPERPALVSLGPLPSWQPPSVLGDGKGASAWAIDADCRHVSTRECAERIRAAFGQLGWLGPGRRYLKLDSTLRGNVGAALEAAQDWEGRQGVVLAPAFPERGRTVVGGALLVDGKPVAETEIATDGAAPVTISEVAGIVRRQWNCRSAVFDPRNSHTPQELASRLTQAIYNDFHLLVMDSQSSQHLQMIAAAVDDPKLRHEWPGVLPAGSAGLARGFATIAGVCAPGPAQSPMHTRCGVLAVIGSRTRASAMQIEALSREGVDCLIADAPDTVGRAAAVLESGAAVALTPGAGDHRSVAAAAADVLARLGDIGLVLSGGATARRFCELAGIRHMWIIGELQPGVAVGRAVTPDSEAMPLVIKGGAAGSATVMVEAIRWLRGESAGQGEVM